MVNKLKELSYLSYTGEKIFMDFKCDCGCTNLYRNKKQYHLSFFEGYFICLECKKHHNYYSDSFYKINYQITLF